MDLYKDLPVGMTRHAELLNILVSLDETGGCDRRTLQIVAQSVGIRDYFDREVSRLNGAVVAVGKPVFLLRD